MVSIGSRQSVWEETAETIMNCIATHERGKGRMQATPEEGK